MHSMASSTYLKVRTSRLVTDHVLVNTEKILIVGNEGHSAPEVLQSLD